MHSTYADDRVGTKKSVPFIARLRFCLASEQSSSEGLLATLIRPFLPTPHFARQADYGQVAREMKPSGRDLRLDLRKPDLLGKRPPKIIKQKISL